ncbi:MAG: ketoacyl-ACP synthase III [Treponema sp.]|nr:ketoacyl-ACP synthase III [Treponema sp.]
MYHAQITGTGLYSPDKIETNADLNNFFGTPIKDTFENKIGIRQRHITGDAESSVDMATKAGEKAIKDAGIKAEDLGLVVIATDTPEYISPPTACVVQGRLQAVNAGAYDINGACSGFVASLDAMSRIVMSGGHKHVLLIGVYNMTKYVDRANAGLVPLFGDGAGAVVVSRTEEDRGFVGSKLFADGTQYDLMGIYAGGTKYPLTPERIANKEYMLQSLKPLPADRNIKLWPPIITELMEKHGMKTTDIDFIICTQINRWIIESVMPILGLPMEKTICIMGEYGYTGSACIPMALDTARKTLDKPKKGDNVVFIASGVGLAVASTLFKW